MKLEFAIEKMNRLVNHAKELETLTPCCFDVSIFDRRDTAEDCIYFELSCEGKEDEHVGNFWKDFDSMEELEMYMEAMIIGIKISKGIEV